VHEKGGLSPNTVHHVHAVLHRALRDAVKSGYLQTNPAGCADSPRASAQHKELPVCSEEQLRASLDSVRQERLYPLWRFLAMTGCRRGRPWDRPGATWISRTTVW
jgi:integrase